MVSLISCQCKRWILILFFLAIPMMPFAQFGLVSTGDSIYINARKFSDRGIYNKSLEEHLKAIRIFEIEQNHIALAKSFNAIGLIYDKLKNYKLSREFYDKSLQELETKPDKLLLSYVLNNIGMSLESQEKLDSAELYYKNSLELKVEMKDSSGISRTLNNMGGLWLLKGDYNKSLAIYFESVSIKKLINDTIGLATSYSNIANIYGWKGLLDSTSYYLNKGMKYGPFDFDLSLYSIYYQNFSALYSSKGNFEMAYYYSDSSNLIQSRIFHNELASELANHQVIYDLEKKEAQIHNQRLKNNLLLEKQLHERKQKWIYISLSFTLFLFLVLFYFVIKNRSQRIKHQQILHDKEIKLSEVTVMKAKQQEKLLEQEIEIKASQLLSSSTLTFQKQEIIIQLKEQLKILKEENKDISPSLLKAFDAIFRQNMNLDQEWNRFKVHFEEIHTSFFSRLKVSFPNLTELDLRHCAYIKIGLSTKEISILLNISPPSVQKSRVRLKKKLKLSQEQDLRQFLQNDLS